MGYLLLGIGAFNAGQLFSLGRARMPATVVWMGAAISLAIGLVLGLQVGVEPMPNLETHNGYFAVTHDAYPESSVFHVRMSKQPGQIESADSTAGTTSWRVGYMHGLVKDAEYVHYWSSPATVDAPDTQEITLRTDGRRTLTVWFGNEQVFHSDQLQQLHIQAPYQPYLEVQAVKTPYMSSFQNFWVAKDDRLHLTGLPGGAAVKLVDEQGGTLGEAVASQAGNTTLELPPYLTKGRGTLEISPAGTGTGQAGIIRLRRRGRTPGGAAMNAWKFGNRKAAGPPGADAPDVTVAGSAVRPFAIYYGWPSYVNGARGHVASAVAAFDGYGVVVFGDEPQPLRATPWQPLLWRGSLTVAVPHMDTSPSGSLMGNPTIPWGNCVRRIAAWSRLGVRGVLLDCAGEDYGVTRARFDAVVHYAHSLGLSVLANAWDPDDVLAGSRIMGPGDGYLGENDVLSDGQFLSPSTYRPKLAKMAAHKVHLGITLYETATSKDLRQADTLAAQVLATLRGYPIDAFHLTDPMYCCLDNVLVKPPPVLAGAL